jgi:phage repressor protein C with HTH and peptisase S24 domain
MIGHQDIWRGIDRLAAAHGYSASGLAKKAGLDPTSFNKSKRHSPEGKPRWPSTESLSKILAVTGAAMSDFIALTGVEDHGGAASQPQAPAGKMPVIGFAQAGRAGYFDEDGYPAGEGWDEIDFPAAGQKNARCFALQISGESMQPLYRAGDKIVLCPDAAIRRGDRVVVRTAGGEVMAKTLSKRSESRLVLKSLNPGHEDITIPASDIIWIARIMWVSQ